MPYTLSQYLEFLSPEAAAVSVFLISLAGLFLVRAIVQRQLPKIASRHG